MTAPPSEPPARLSPLEEALARRDLPHELFSGTDLGNAERFASRFGDRFRYAPGNASHLRWYTQAEDGRWVANVHGQGEVSRAVAKLVEEVKARIQQLQVEGGEDAEQAEDALRRVSRELSTARAAREIPKMAAENYGMTVSPEDDFNQRGDVLSCAGQLLEFKPDGVTVRAIIPSDHITWDTGTPYRPEILENPPADVTLFLRTFITYEDTQPEREHLIFKALGAQLTAGNPHRMLLIIKGESTSGKGMLQETLLPTLGDYAGKTATTIFHGNATDAPRPDIIKAMHLRIGVLSELSQGIKLHADRVKEITGDATISVRGMHSDNVLDLPIKVTPLIFTNETPRIVGFDPATKRRIVVMPFDRNLSPEEEDPAIKERFTSNPDVRAWLLARLVKGWVDAQREGLQDVRDAFAQARDAALENADPLEVFLEHAQAEGFIRIVDVVDRSSTPTSHYVRTSEFYDAFVEFLEKYDVAESYKQRMGLKALTRVLQKPPYSWVKKDSAGARWEGVILTTGMPNWTPH